MGHNYITRRVGEPSGCERRHNYIGHTYMAHNYITRRVGGPSGCERRHNYIGHTYMAHNYITRRVGGPSGCERRRYSPCATRTAMSSTARSSSTSTSRCCPSSPARWRDLFFSFPRGVSSHPILGRAGSSRPVALQQHSFCLGATAATSSPEARRRPSRAGTVAAPHRWASPARGHNYIVVACIVMACTGELGRRGERRCRCARRRILARGGVRSSAARRRESPPAIVAPRQARSLGVARGGGTWSI